MDSSFSGFSSLQKVNLYNFYNNRITGVNSTFYRCTSLKEVNAYNFFGNRITTLNKTFFGCTSLQKLNFSNYKKIFCQCQYYRQKIFTICIHLRIFSFPAAMTEHAAPTFRSLKQAADVAAVFPDRHRRQKADDQIHLIQMRLRHVKQNAILAADNRAKENIKINGNRPEGNVTCQRKYDKIKSKPDRTENRGQHEIHAGGGGNSLSALKMQITRKIVSENDSGARIYRQKRNHIRM